jgi:hypothetical protein
MSAQESRKPQKTQEKPSSDMLFYNPFADPSSRSVFVPSSQLIDFTPVK